MSQQTKFTGSFKIIKTCGCCNATVEGSATQYDYCVGCSDAMDREDVPEDPE